jgi:hypothetical protein
MKSSLSSDMAALLVDAESLAAGCASRCQLASWKPLVLGPNLNHSS